MIDQGNLNNSPQQVIQNRIMTVIGLLKSGKVRLRRTIDQGKPDKTSWSTVQQVRPHRGDILLDGDAQSVRYGGMLLVVLGNLIIPTSKKWQKPEFSSWTMTQKNLGIKKKTKCEVDRKECRTLQNQVKSIQQFRECSWLRR